MTGTDWSDVRKRVAELATLAKVSGPARGTMWADDTAEVGGVSPMLSPDGTPASFADWYRRWLDYSFR